MVIVGLAVVVGIGLLILFAVAAARLQPRRAQAAHSGSDGGEATWIAGIGGDNDAAGDCGNGGSDGGSCDGGGGGGGD